VSQADLLTEAVDALDSVGVGYVLTGSLASKLGVVELLAAVRAAATTD
jgi:hypothetical protein